MCNAELVFYPAHFLTVAAVVWKIVWETASTFLAQWCAIPKIRTVQPDIIALRNNSRTALTVGTTGQLTVGYYPASYRPDCVWGHQCHNYHTWQKTLCVRHKCNRDQAPCTATTYDAYTKETDQVIWHVILMSLHQECGHSFPDQLPNDGSNFEEVEWVQD